MNHKFTGLLVFLLLPSACGSDPPILVEMNEAEDKIRRGDAYYVEGAYARAIPLYEEGLYVRPTWGEPYKKLAACHEQTGRPDRAIRTLKKYLVEVDSRDTMVLANLARLYELQKAWGEALETYKRLQELAPEHAEIKDHIQRVEGHMKEAPKQQ